MIRKEFRKRRDSILKEYKDDPAGMDLALRLLQLEIYNDIAENLDEVRSSIESIVMQMH